MRTSMISLTREHRWSSKQFSWKKPDSSNREESHPSRLRRLLPLGWVLAVLAPFPALTLAQPVCPPVNAWQQSYGGGSYEDLPVLRAAPGGGYYLGSYSYSSDQFRTNTTYGRSDYWILHLDSEGAVLSERSYGGSSYDAFADLQPVGSSGLIVGGSSRSDVSGIKTTPHFGTTVSEDYWVLRLDAQGEVIWERNLGGDGGETLAVVTPIAGDGFLVAGSSWSDISGNKTVPNFSSPSTPHYDFWVLKLDTNSVTVWEQAYGGAEQDTLSAVVPTSDGGFLLGGTSDSDVWDAKDAPLLGSRDYWIVRIDADGNRLWDKTLGGPGWDVLSALVPAGDGGFLVAGNSGSPAGEGKSAPLHGSMDFWVVRIDAEGNRLWDRSFGGPTDSALRAATVTADGGFVLAGSTAGLPGGNRTSIWYGSRDGWVVSLDPAGELRWDQSFGALGWDEFHGVVAGPDGSLLLAGISDSEPREAKTSPSLGVRDLWLVQLLPESTDDCDGDGVSNAHDDCPGTPSGALVDANGCALEQHCPCGGPWTGHAEYVDCVAEVSARFVSAGLISELERTALLEQAQLAECPVIPQSVIMFGLTNVALGEAQLDAEDPYQRGLSVRTIGPRGTDGVSVLLGAADSGVFLYPDAHIWGWYDANWFMTGTAYGSLDGHDGSALATVRGTKPDYEVYPVAFDLSPLHPVSLTIQVFSGDTLVVESTVPGATGEIVVNTSSYLGPRVNPVWRMPNGAVGVLIEFTEGVVEGSGWPNLEGPFGASSGDRVFVRADHPARRLDYVSRTDVILGGGLEQFAILDARIGVFGRPHQALEAGLLEPAPGRLTLRRGTEFPSPTAGVLIELESTGTFELDLEPLALNHPGDSIRFYPSGRYDIYEDILGRVELAHEESGTLTVTLGLNSLTARLDAYRDGHRTGTLISTNSSILTGTMRAIDGEDPPHIIGLGTHLVAYSAHLSLCLTLDRPATLALGEDTELEGDQFLIQPESTADINFILDTFGILSDGIESFTIAREAGSVGAPPLVLGIAEAVESGDGRVQLAWPRGNLPYRLESASDLAGPFEPVIEPPTLEDGVYRLSLPLAGASVRFFQLAFRPDVPGPVIEESLSP